MTPKASRPLGTTRRQFIAGVGAAALAAAFLAACGEDEDPEASPTSTSMTSTATPTGTPGTRIVSHSLGESEVPAEPKRVVALGEEWMLSDLLSLGIQPLASSASGPEVSFLGGVTSLYDVGEVEALSNSEPDFERITALEPDLIITSTVVAENLGDGLGLLQEIAPVVAVPVAGPDFRADYRTFAAVFGKEATAEERLADYDSAVAEAKADIPEGVTTSVASIFDPNYIRVYVAPGSTLVDVLVDLGVALDPDEEALPATLSAGRSEITGEQVNLLQGDHVILLQSEAFDEATVVESVEALPLWQTLPAAQSGQVHVVDRFAHPGVAGRIQAVKDLGAIFAGGE